MSINTTLFGLSIAAEASVRKCDPWLVWLFAKPSRNCAWPNKSCFLVAHPCCGWIDAEPPPIDFTSEVVKATASFERYVVRRLGFGSLAVHLRRVVMTGPVGPRQWQHSPDPRPRHHHHLPPHCACGGDPLGECPGPELC